MVKKILSLLTVMAMLLSSVGITAMAEETVVYTLEELIAAFENGSETIVLGGDIDMSALTTQTKTGTITPAFTATGTSTPVWGEATANSKESFAVKLYEGEKVIAATMLNNNGGIIDGSLSVSWGFWYGSSDAYWTTAWEEGYPNATMAPDKVELYVDGTKVAENVVQLNSPDDLNKIYAAAEDKDGNFLGYFTTVADAAVAANEAGAKVVLKRETTETVEFVEGVVLEKNGFTAANVTVAAPAFVAKIGDVEYESLEEAFAAATEGQTITLLADATLAATATIPAGVTLNGNGKQINGEVWAGGDLTIVGHTKVTNFNAGYNCPTITIG